MDTSVLVSALASEDVNHKAAIDWIAQQQDSLVTSALAEVEMGRALARRKAPASVKAAAVLLLAGCETVEVNAQIRMVAIGIQPANVRSLDAVHIATAAVSEIASFATFDARQAVAAEEAGMTITQI